MKRVGPKRALSTVLMALLLTLGLSSNVFGFLWCVIEPPIGPLHRIGAAAIGTVRYEVITKDFEETARFTFHGTCKGIPVQWKPNEAFVTTCTDVEAFAAASGEEMTQMLEGRLGFGDDLSVLPRLGFFYLDWERPDVNQRRTRGWPPPNHHCS